MAKLSEKIGYGLGDMSSSMFWKIFSYYLPIFYSDVFQLSLGATSLLMLVTRIWDAVSDPMMGMIADRTSTRCGRYRPYLLWMALPFAVAGCLLFTTPSWGESGRLVWAYVTYILMMTIYTGINVPYGSMLAVVTPHSEEKTIFSSYRMFFAYAGSFVVLIIWEPLVTCFQGGESVTDLPAIQQGWQHAMMVVATVCLLLFLFCFRLTRERVATPPAASAARDLRALLKNTPWWLLTAAALCTNLFCTLRGSTAAYYFKYLLGEEAQLSLFGWSFLFYAGLFLAIGEVCNMVGVALAVPISRLTGGKKNAFFSSSILLVVLSILFFYLPEATPRGYWWILILQILTSIFTGVVSPLIWSMYADVADYSNHLHGTSSTGLIFSSGSMAQKFGGAIAGASVMLILDAFGFVPNAVEQTDAALLGMRLSMSWFPAIAAAFMAIVIRLYPLTPSRMGAILEQ